MAEEGKHSNRVVYVIERFMRVHRVTPMVSSCLRIAVNASSGTGEGIRSTVNACTTTGSDIWWF